MGRNAVEVAPLTDLKKRQTVFKKRHVGVMKKAHELSVMCQATIAVIIISDQNELFPFTVGDNIEDVLELYNSMPEDTKKMSLLKCKEEVNTEVVKAKNVKQAKEKKEERRLQEEPDQPNFVAFNEQQSRHNGFFMEGAQNHQVQTPYIQMPPQQFNHNKSNSAMSLQHSDWISSDSLMPRHEQNSNLYVPYQQLNGNTSSPHMTYELWNSSSYPHANENTHIHSIEGQNGHNMQLPFQYQDVSKNTNLHFIEGQNGPNMQPPY